MNTRTNRKTVAELAALVGGRVVAGDGTEEVERVASLESARPGAVVFVEEAKFLEEAGASEASCVIVPRGAETEGLRAAIEAERPKLAFALIAEVLHAPVRRESGRHPTAQVSESAQVDESASIGAFVVIEDGAQVGARTQLHAGTVVGASARVGADCVLHPRVVLYEGAWIGDRVILHAGVVVGADGFGYVREGEQGYRKFPQLGRVIIEDDVEIGAQTCIDRGALGETRIGRGTKIDNLVQIAHNVTIGEHVVIASQTGISGSTVIESDAVIGGQVGFGDHARVERGAIIGSKAGVLPGKIVRAGTVMWGVPVRPLDEYKRLNAHFGRLPQMRAEIEELRRQLKELLSSRQSTVESREPE
ncbi:MAG TPA: UDP-3-O-(3-hydroxymyristoyl)glucosamine N-acyltransferase [Pyrinomonadaceae bacterium]|nr:UDP-3-O-(3-hydroxymyristoyl)glucosamine N-acyltransferase [Pyrinomonadaceae bacterium]